MKTSERLEALFPLEEQIDIVWTIGGIKQKYEEDKVPVRRRYYFREIADRYQLGHRLTHQLEAYEKGLLRADELTTDKDLEKLFLVNLSAVQNYLSSKLTPKELKDRATLCLEAGRTRGWNYLVKSGQKHVLTNEDVAARIKNVKKKKDDRKRKNQ